MQGLDGGEPLGIAVLKFLLELSTENHIPGEKTSTLEGVSTEGWTRRFIYRGWDGVGRFFGIIRESIIFRFPAPSRSLLGMLLLLGRIPSPVTANDHLTR